MGENFLRDLEPDKARVPRGKRRLKALRPPGALAAVEWRRNVAEHDR
jgi:hypothetical protein